jgi:hypothetical protein
LDANKIPASWHSTERLGTCVMGRFKMGATLIYCRTVTSRLAYLELPPSMSAAENPFVSQPGRRCGVASLEGLWMANSAAAS